MTSTLFRRTALLLPTVFAIPWTSVAGQASEPRFVSDVVFDTVASIGAPDETNPLRLYWALSRLQLADPTRVLYGERGRGRIVLVDFVSGAGWEVDDGGGDGPGEFGGRSPWFSSSAGRLFTVSQSMQGAMRDLDGRLVDSWRYPETLRGIDALGVTLLHGGVLVTRRIDLPNEASNGAEIDQRIRAIGRDGRTWSFDLPSLVMSSTGALTGPGEGIGIHARNATVIVFQNRARWLVALNADGTERARVDLPYDVFTGFVSADDRVWLQVWARNEARTGSYVVLDRNLQFVLNVAERSVVDAWGDYLLTTSKNDVGGDMMHLLRRRR